MNDYPLCVHESLAHFNSEIVCWITFAAIRDPFVFTDGETVDSISRACQELRVILGNANLWVGERTMTRCADQLAKLVDELRAWAGRYPARRRIEPVLQDLLDAVRAAEQGWSSN